VWFAGSRSEMNLRAELLGAPVISRCRRSLQVVFIA
jgi:hypothetical protein